MIRNAVSYSIILVAFFAGCSSTHEVLKNEVTGLSDTIAYSVIYYIHADAGYLYHDPDGEPVQANTRALDTALAVAENAHSGEVIIYYQRPGKKILGLFPQKRSRFYHYRNGQKSTQVTYRHSDKDEPFLATEAQLYKQYADHTPEADRQRYFLYFGHEIPEAEGANYHRTLPNVEVHTASMAGGLRQFLGAGDQKFDLVVLSTCNNGTPDMAEGLMPVTELLLASPQNLHLSHIDSDSLAMLEGDPGPSSVELAHAMAEQTYRRLAATIHTTITLALYDLDLVRPYINELHTSAKRHEQSSQDHLFQDHVDCAQFSFFDAVNYQAGVETWYKPAQFGRDNKLETHSGWGCRPRSSNERITGGAGNK